MEEPDSATRVEIELTANDDSRPRRRKGSAVATEPAMHDGGIDPTPLPPELESQLPPAPMTPPDSHDRRKLVAGGVAVAIVALFVGWALGRSGGGSTDEAAQPTATVADTSPSDTAPLAEIPTTVPVTTRPVVRVAPTTTLPEWEASTIAVDPAAAALGIQIVSLNASGVIAEIDTATGEMQTLRTRLGFGQPPFVHAGSDWVVIRYTDLGNTMLVRDGELPEPVDVGDTWAAQFERDSGLFWRIPPGFSSAESLHAVEVDHEGNVTGRSFDIPPGIWPMGGDPAGGVIIGAPGGTYSIGPDGVRRLTTGNLIALSPSKVLATECGDDFSTCGAVVIDRATGERADLPLEMPAGRSSTVFDIQSAGFWGSPELTQMISPDDRWAPVMLSNGPQQFGLVDLTSGEFVPLLTDPPTSIWWSPDGRSLLYVEHARLKLFDMEQRTAVDILPPDVSTNAFAVRLPF